MATVSQVALQVAPRGLHVFTLQPRDTALLPMACDCRSSGRDRRCVRWGATVSSHVSPAVRVRGVPVLTWLDLGVGRLCVAGDWPPGAHPRPAFGCAAAPSGGWLALMRGGAVLDVPGRRQADCPRAPYSNCTSLYRERARDGT